LLFAGRAIAFENDELSHGRAIVTRFAICLIGVVLTCTPATAAEQVKFILDWAFQGIHGLFTLADDNGYFAKEGLAVKIDRGHGSGDTITKVAAGTYDIGLADVNSLVAFNAKNPGNKVVSFFIPFDRSEAAIIALKKSGIENPKDLRGKTIAAPAGTSMRLLFPIFASVNGFDGDSVKWLTAAPAVKDTLLFRGQADAVTGFPSTSVLFLEGQGIVRSDLVVLSYANYGLDLFGSGLVASETFVAKHPDVLKAFMRAVIKGMRDGLAKPEAAVASVTKRDGLIDRDLELARFNMLAEAAVMTPNVRANGFSHVDDERLRRIIGYVAKSMDIQSAPQPGDIFRGDFLPPVDDRKP
jgi:NitT/TauT family transport system substrate-binding protein